MATPPSSGARRRRQKGKGEAPIVRRGTVRLPHDVARRIRLGHPWVYREALGQRVLRERSGDPIELVDWDGDFVGHGFFDGATAISVRVISRERKVRPSGELVARRVRSAVALRRALIDFDRFHCLRLVNGESDGLPAMVADRYGDYIVAQLFTEAVTGYRQAFYQALSEALAPAGMYEQKRYRSLAGEPLRQGAELVRGAPAPVELAVREGDLRFYVDVTAPLSPGLFPDLRDGRRAVAGWAKGKRVLNLFSYSGACSVYALHGGAAELVAVDVAAKAHARARRNMALNGLDPEAAELITGDALKVLARFAERGRRFDLAILDPPAFASASRGGSVWSAAKDYGELVAATLRVVPPGGALVAASATHKLSQSDFDQALARGAVAAQTELRIVERCALPADFPTTPGFPEGNYLKFVIAVRD